MGGRETRGLAAAMTVAFLLALGVAPSGVSIPRDARAAEFEEKIVFSSYRTAGPGVVNPEGDSEIFSVNPDGTGLRQLTSNGLSDVQPAWSPDGTRIAFERETPRQDPDGFSQPPSDIYKMNADGSSETPLTGDLSAQSHNPAEERNENPAWSPDGRFIAFSTNRDGGRDEIYRMGSNGAGPTNLTRRPTRDLDPVWSPGGGRIAFSLTPNSGGADIYGIRPNGSDETRLTSGPQYEYEPDFSPNGRVIAFMGYRYREASFSPHVYKASARGSRPVRLTGAEDLQQAGAPAWSPDGRRITFHGQPKDSNDSDFYIYSMRPDGSDVQQITEGFAPDWARVPATP